MVVVVAGWRRGRLAVQRGASGAATATHNHHPRGAAHQLLLGFVVDEVREARQWRYGYVAAPRRVLPRPLLGALRSEHSADDIVIAVLIVAIVVAGAVMPHPAR